MTMRHKKDNFFSIRLQNDRLFKTAIKAVTSCTTDPVVQVQFEHTV